MLVKDGVIVYMNILYVHSLNRIFESCIAIRYIRSYILSRAVSSKQSSMDYLRLPYNCPFLVKYLTSLILTTYKCKIPKLLISKSNEDLFTALYFCIVNSHMQFFVVAKHIIPISVLVTCIFSTLMKKIMCYFIDF